MPEYTYVCLKCGEFNIWQSIVDDKIKVCPKCGSEVTRSIGGGNFNLKGGCWSKDGYKK